MPLVSGTRNRMVAMDRRAGRRRRSRREVVRIPAVAASYLAPSAGVAPRVERHRARGCGNPLRKIRRRVVPHNAFTQEDDDEP